MATPTHDEVAVQTGSMAYWLQASFQAHLPTTEEHERALSAAAEEKSIG